MAKKSKDNSKEKIKLIEDKIKEYKLEKRIFLTKKVLYFSIIGILFTLMIWLKYNVTFEVSKGLLIATASLSIMFNIIVIGILLATGIGRKAVKRFKQRLLYITGRFVNTIYCNKNGVIKEIFKKIDSETGTFKIDGKTYCRNPALLFNFDRIPTYFHREGNPDPVNIWDDKKASDMSNSEIDTVMYSRGAFDLKEWLNKNKFIIILTLLIILGAAILSSYFAYMTYQMLRDGTMSAAGNIIPPNM